MLLVLLCIPLPALCEEAPTAYFNPACPPPLPPEHAPAADDYFSDAVFIGDSMMEYVEIYELLPTAHFAWRIGMSPMSVGRKQFRVRGAEEMLTTYEYAKQYDPKKLYLWLGANGLDIKSSQDVIRDYELVADEVISRFPQAMVYVISPPPMTKARMNKEEYVIPGRYAKFEQLLRELAERRNFYYIDLYHMVADEDGYLPDTYCMGDGFHLNKPAYTMLTDALRACTVPYETEEEK